MQKAEKTVVSSRWFEHGTVNSSLPFSKTRTFPVLSKASRRDELVRDSVNMEMMT